MSRSPLALAPNELAELEADDWPGNVRELRNVLERAVISTPHAATHMVLSSFGARARAPKAPRTAARSSSAPPAKPMILPEAEIRRLERDNLLAALEATRGQIFGPGGAADLLGVKPTTLASRLKKLRLPEGS
jgi:transcriptional regulator with GAF, ATPase, and Fis domain